MKLLRKKRQENQEVYILLNKQRYHHPIGYFLLYLIAQTMDPLEHLIDWLFQAKSDLVYSLIHKCVSWLQRLNETLSPLFWTQTRASKPSARPPCRQTFPDLHPAGARSPLGGRLGGRRRIEDVRRG